jgi:diguanylate cyclase (GGDEF)-like protein
MSEARAQRDRRLIQRTAALLSEDYPLDQLVARLCEALASELSSELAFVALSADVTLPLRVVGASGARAANLDGDAVAAEGTPAHSAYLAGTPISILGPDDLRAYARGADFPIGSGIFVPIPYGERTLGTLAVCSERPGAFDEQDVRLACAIARYLGIAVRNQGGDSGPVSRRGNILVYAIVLLVALVASTGIWAYVASRTQEVTAEARDGAMTGLRVTGSALSNYIDVSSQLAATAAVLYAKMPHDRRIDENALVELLSSAQSPSIYGVGVWYQPYRFAPGVRLYGPYAKRRDAKIEVTQEWMRASYDFPSHSWYRIGIAARGALAYTEPYFDTDFVYVSAVRAFRDPKGQIEGVVTVDSTLPHLESLMRNPYARSLTFVTSASGKALLTSDDTAFLAYAAARGAAVKSVTSIPPGMFAAFLSSRAGDDLEDLSVPLPVEGWRLHLAVDRALLFAGALRIRAAGIGAVVLVWLAAFGSIVAIRVARRSAAHTTDLEREQIELTREIADRKKAEERLRERAYRDELTRLPNRAFVIGELQRSLDGLRLEGNERFAVLFIDLDRFNLINDSLGHDTGDLLLAEIAHRLRDVAGADRVIARLGGDEFVVLLPGAGEAEAVELAERVLATVRRPFSVSGHELYVSASAGVALADARYSMPEEVLRDADAAMYEAKRAGRATVRVFDQSMHTRAMEALALETDLRQGLPRGEIYAAYQPIVSLADERVVGFEALARWRQPVRGVVPTEDFIRVAEHTGLIVDIDETVITQACTVARGWIAEFPDLYLSVNVSPAHLMRIDDLAVVRRVLETTAFPAASLRAELTETAIMERGPKSVGIFRHLRQLGVGIMVDDFGTGYSSLGYLQRLPIEGLKIDRSFVSEMMHDEKALEIVRAILAIAKALGLHVVAEGTETREEVEALRAMGVEFAQGYFFSRPLDAEAALAYVRKTRASSQSVIVSKGTTLSP